MYESFENINCEKGIMWEMNHEKINDSSGKSHI